MTTPLDSETKEAFVDTSNGMKKVDDGFPRTGNPALSIPLDQILD